VCQLSAVLIGVFCVAAGDGPRDRYARKYFIVAQRCVVDRLYTTLALESSIGIPIGTKGFFGSKELTD
jgi:hypothetical protein